MATLNEGFGGWSTVYSCDYPQFGNDPDPHPITFAGDGIYNPANAVCGAGSTVVIPGVDGTSQSCWTSRFGTGSTPGNHSLITDVFAPDNPHTNTITGQFGLMSTVGINGVYINYQNGDMHAGLCCAVNGSGRTGDGTRGFAFVLSKVASLAYPNELFGHSIGLVAIENGFTEYTVIASQENAWVDGTFYRLTLSWTVDPDFLKGIYLKATINSTVFAEVVYTKAGSYRPTGQGACGKFAIAPPTSSPNAGTRVIIFHKA